MSLFSLVCTLSHPGGCGWAKCYVTQPRSCWQWHRCRTVGMRNQMPIASLPPVLGSKCHQWRKENSLVFFQGTCKHMGFKDCIMAARRNGQSPTFSFPWTALATDEPMSLWMHSLSLEVGEDGILWQNARWITDRSQPATRRPTEVKHVNSTTMPQGWPPHHFSCFIFLSYFFSYNLFIFSPFCLSLLLRPVILNSNPSESHVNISEKKGSTESLLNQKL